MYTIVSWNYYIAQRFGGGTLRQSSSEVVINFFASQNGVKSHQPYYCRKLLISCEPLNINLSFNERTSLFILKWDSFLEVCLSSPIRAHAYARVTCLWTFCSHYFLSAVLFQRFCACKEEMNWKMILQIINAEHCLDAPLPSFFNFSRSHVYRLSHLGTRCLRWPLT